MGVREKAVAVVQVVISRLSVSSRHSASRRGVSVAVSIFGPPDYSDRGGVGVAVRRPLNYDITSPHKKGGSGRRRFRIASSTTSTTYSTSSSSSSSLRTATLPTLPLFLPPPPARRLSRFSRRLEL
ncbi:hypothetical protein E2C01_071731 [Portunus trituberculatus]|uniref:Uncharacterized protein n=1 Tax=Portunus trituberculatus TaxID=210409 RepID=A0A5B7HXS5_PORTR|nr:hypothetical protein [Portunus trituberculatus]